MSDKKYFTNLDFASLYPNISKSDTVYSEELVRMIERRMKRKNRIDKLNKINDINERQ